MPVQGGTKPPTPTVAEGDASSEAPEEDLFPPSSFSWRHQLFMVNHDDTIQHQEILNALNAHAYTFEDAPPAPPDPRSKTPVKDDVETEDVADADPFQLPQMKYAILTKADLIAAAREEKWDGFPEEDEEDVSDEVLSRFVRLYLERDTERGKKKKAKDARDAHEKRLAAEEAAAAAAAEDGTLAPPTKEKTKKDDDKKKKRGAPAPSDSAAAHYSEKRPGTPEETRYKRREFQAYNTVSPDICYLLDVAPMTPSLIRALWDADAKVAALVTLERDGPELAPEASMEDKKKGKKDDKEKLTKSGKRSKTPSQGGKKTPGGESPSPSPVPSSVMDSQSSILGDAERRGSRLSLASVIERAAPLDPLSRVFLARFKLPSPDGQEAPVETKGTGKNRSANNTPAPGDVSGADAIAGPLADILREAAVVCKSYQEYVSQLEVISGLDPPVHQVVVPQASHLSLPESPRGQAESVAGTAAGDHDDHRSVKDSEAAGEGDGDTKPDDTPAQQVVEISSDESRLYHRLMDGLPESRLSVPVILECMLRQVEANNSENGAPTSFREESFDEIMELAMTSVLPFDGESTARKRRPLSVSESESLAQCTPVRGMKTAGKGTAHMPVLIRHGDNISQPQENVDDGGMKTCRGFVRIDPMEFERNILGLVRVPGRDRDGMPPAPTLSEEERDIERSQLYHFCDLPPATIDRTLVLMEFERMLADHDPSRQWFLDDRAYYEDYQADVIPQVYLEGLLQEPEVLTRYYAEEDVLLLAMHHTVPSSKCTSAEWSYGVPRFFPMNASQEECSDFLDAEISNLGPLAVASKKWKVLLSACTHANSATPTPPAGLQSVPSHVSISQEGGPKQRVYDVPAHAIVKYEGCMLYPIDSSIITGMRSVNRKHEFRVITLRCDDGLFSLAYTPSPHFSPRPPPPCDPEPSVCDGAGAGEEEGAGGQVVGSAGKADEGSQQAGKQTQPAGSRRGSRVQAATPERTVESMGGDGVTIDASAVSVDRLVPDPTWGEKLGAVDEYKTQLTVSFSDGLTFTVWNRSPTEMCVSATLENGLYVELSDKGQVHQMKDLSHAKIRSMRRDGREKDRDGKERDRSSKSAKPREHDPTKPPLPKKLVGSASVGASGGGSNPDGPTVCSTKLPQTTAQKPPGNSSSHGGSIAALLQKERGSNEDEVWCRQVVGRGTTVVHRKDGSAVAYLASGATMTSRGGGEAWDVTTLRGARYTRHADGRKTPLSRIESVQNTDAETRSVIVSRADLTLVTTRRDGVRIADHADGTRVVTARANPDSEKNPGTRTPFVTSNLEVPRAADMEDTDSFVYTVEKSGYATVQVSNGGQRVRVKIPGGEGVTELRYDAMFDGIYLIRPTGTVHVVPDRKIVVYSPNVEDLPSHSAVKKNPPTYTFNLKRPGLRLTEGAANTYEVDEDMHGTVMLAGSRRQSQPAHNAAVANPAPDGSAKISILDKIDARFSQSHAPRLFVVRPDGSGYEALRDDDIGPLIARTRNSETATVLTEADPDGNGVEYHTLLTPRVVHNAFTAPPYGPPPAVGLDVRKSNGRYRHLHFRQLQREHPLDIEGREKLIDGLQKWKQWKMEMDVLADKQVIPDERDEVTKETERIIQEEIAEKRRAEGKPVVKPLELSKLHRSGSTRRKTREEQEHDAILRYNQLQTQTTPRTALGGPGGAVEGDENDGDDGPMAASSEMSRECRPQPPPKGVYHSRVGVAELPTHRSLKAEYSSGGFNSYFTSPHVHQP